jgi:lipoate-protein ligase A
MLFPRPSRFIRKLSTTSEKVPVDINVIRVKNMPVLHMLRLEESLFRYDSNNWCVINSGTPPCVVVGRSSVIEDTVRVENTRAAGIPIIRRFTGGGVV